MYESCKVSVTQAFWLNASTTVVARIHLRVNMFIASLLIALLACCSPTSGEVWEDVQVPCESLWSAAAITTWQPNRRYTITNCPVNITSPSPIFTVVLPTLTSNTSTHTTCGSNNENVAYFGSIAVTVLGGTVAPRFVLPSSVPTSQQIHVVNVSMVLDGVSVRLQGSLSPDGAPLGGMDPLREGGLLMAIIAHSWWNVSLQIRHSIMMVTPGWIFNWTSDDARSVTKRIAGLVALSIIPSSPPACNSSSGGAYLVVSNSSVNMTGVIGVSVLFHIDLTSGSSTSTVAAVHNVHFQIEKASRVGFELFSNEADMCTTLTTELKLRLSEQFIFLVSGVGDSDYDLGEGTTVTNVSCALTSSTVSIAYNPDKRCRGNRSRMDAGVAHLRGHGVVRAVSFVLSSSEPHSVVVAPLLVPTPTTVVVSDSWSRAFVFGISLANTATDVAVNATGTQTECTVVASDFATYFMLFNIAVLLRSSINVSDASFATIATGGTGMLGRVAGVVVLEYVNSTINAQTALTSLRLSVQSQPGNGTKLMATSTSMFYVKGGMMDCNTSLRHCSFIGNAVGGVLQGPPLLMVTISVVTYLPVAKEFNITNTTLLLLNCSMTSMVAVNAIPVSTSPLMSTFMIIASVALVVAPILTISSTIEVAQCAASIAALEIQGSVPLKRSALGAMLSSTPIPSEGMLKLVTASSGYGPEQSTLIELLRLSPYRNVTVIVTQTNLTMVPDAFYLSTSSGFEGAFVVILPRTLINDSSIFLSECSFQNPSRSANHEPQSTGAAFFLSSIVGAVGPSIINNSVVSATSMTTFAHGMTTGEGELVFGVGAMIMLSELDVRSYANDAPPARELHQSPLVALQPTTSAFIPPTVTNMVVQPGSCIVVHDSTFRGFQNLTTNVLFPAPTSLTNASLRGLSSWLAPWMAGYCGGDSSVDKRILLSCVMWSYPSTAHDGSSIPPLRPATKVMAALRAIPPSNIRISSCGNSFTSTPELTVSHPPHAAGAPPATMSVVQRGINGILGFTSSAAAAVSAVLGGGGMVAADFQALALMGVSPCAPSNLQSSSSISRYILVSPFYDLGDEAQIVGGIGLVLVVVLLQHSVRATTSNVVTSNSFTDATCHNKEGRDEENAKDLVAPRRKSIFDEFMEFITSILQQYPKHSYTIAVILIPGVWRSTIAILLQGGDGAAWGAAGSIIVAIIGACSVVWSSSRHGLVKSLQKDDGEGAQWWYLEAAAVSLQNCYAD